VIRKGRPDRGRLGQDWDIGMRILVTGGAGFIGSAVVRRGLAEAGHDIVTLDKLTYAAHPDNLAEVADHPRHTLLQGDIADARLVAAAFATHRPEAVLHLAAESHVDRSIDGPAAFVETNIVGTYTLLDAARAYWEGLDAAGRAAFRFHHVSTDEVFGSLGPEGRFDEATAYAPNSPYSASKASSDMLARAWHRTYGLPVLITNCSNNFGPRQFPEKLIPHVAIAALEGRPVPVYGDGSNVRDWLYVEDHAEALLLALARGRPGETYCIGGGTELANIDLVRAVLRLLDELRPDSPHRPHEGLIRFVADRPGHDRRYAVDAGKIARELGWQPRTPFATALRRTVHWYLDRPDWWEAVRARGLGGGRLGLGRQAEQSAPAGGGAR
jgi:dTDP-glucose 4,6-dehydratase